MSGFISPAMMAALLAILGAIIGSFIGAAVLRVPRGRGVVRGRSHCDGCGAVLGATDLIPIFSYMLLRGHCRYCRDPIAIDQPIAECGGVVVGLVAAMSAQSVVGAAAFAIFGWVLLSLALLDVRHFWLPNALTIPLLLAGLAIGWIVPEISMPERLLGALCGYGLLEVLRIGYHRMTGREGLGRGDAKLLAAIGAWLGITALPWIVLTAASVGLIWAGVRGGGRSGSSRHDRLPLGTLLCGVAIAVLPIIVSSGRLFVMSPR